MTTTPMLDAAIRAAAIEVQGTNDEEGTRYSIAAALRTALPWTPAPAVIEVIARAMCKAWGADPDKPFNSHEGQRPVWTIYKDAALAAYRAQPILKELWPEGER